MKTQRVFCSSSQCLLMLICANFVCHVANAQSISEAGAKVQAVGQVAFIEGPVWHPDGFVLFSDVQNSRIMRRTAGGEVEVFRTPSGKANGLVFDLEGRLLACEGGSRRVTRTEHDGKITVLADRFDGQRFNSPNDITIDSRGRIYFTDPRYGDRDGMEMSDSKGRMVEGVYRIDLDGKISRILSQEVLRPNGLAIAPDEKFIFIADNGSSADRRVSKLLRFALNSHGDVDPKSQTVLFDWGDERGPDGIAIDQESRIYATAGLSYADDGTEATKFPAAVYVIDPNGAGLIERIDVPLDVITNCAFGGDDLRTLFITSGHKLWSIRMKTAGHVTWLAK